MFWGQLFCLFLNNNSFLSDGSSLYYQVVVFKTTPLGEKARVLVTYPTPARTSSWAHTRTAICLAAWLWGGFLLCLASLPALLLGIWHLPGFLSRLLLLGWAHIIALLPSYLALDWPSQLGPLPTPFHAKCHECTCFLPCFPWHTASPRWPVIIIL